MNINEDIIKNVINIDETAGNSRVNFVIGKNMFPKTTSTTITGSKNGVTYSINEDGTILLNGTCTTGFNVISLAPYITYNNVNYKTVILSGTHSGNDLTMVLQMDDDSYTYIPISNGVPAVRKINGKLKWAGLYVNNGCVCNNLLIEPYLSYNLNPSTYAEYKNPVIYANGEEIYNKEEVDTAKKQAQSAATIMSQGMGIFRGVYPLLTKQHSHSSTTAETGKILETRYNFIQQISSYFPAPGSGYTRKYFLFLTVASGNTTSTLYLGGTKIAEFSVWGAQNDISTVTQRYDITSVIAAMTSGHKNVTIDSTTYWWINRADIFIYDIPNN